MGRCATCGARLEDPAQRLCGGDRCLRVWLRHGGQGAPESQREETWR